MQKAKTEAAVDHRVELEKLHRLLGNFKEAGLESTAGVADELPTQPDLYVNDYGYVPLPLMKNSAEDLLNRCRSINDNCYELEAKDFLVRDPQWNSCLTRLIDRICSALSWHETIVPKMEKLMLYKKGSLVNKHQLTTSEEKTNTFGKLVLQLPSVYEGGEFVCHHRDKSIETYKLGGNGNDCHLKVTFLSHKANVPTQMLEVKSGCRLVLVYSLCLAGGDKKTNTTDATLMPSLARSLGQINDGSSKFAVQLDHLYEKSSLSSSNGGLKALKGVDKDRVSLLRQANSLLPAEKQFDFYIVRAKLTIELYETGSYDRNDGYSNYKRKKAKRSRHHDDTEYENSESEYIDSVGEWDECKRYDSFEVYDSNGAVTDCNVDASVFKRVLNPSNTKQPFVDLDDEKNWGGKKVSIGDSDVCERDTIKTVKYHKCLLAFWPRHMNFKSLLEFSSLKQCVGKVYDAIMANSSNGDVKNFEALVDYLQNFEDNDFDPTSIEKMFVMCQKLNRLDLLNQIVSQIPSVTINHIFSLLSKFKWNSIENCLRDVLLPVTMNFYLDFNMDLTLKLLDAHGKETAFACFQFAVAPILDQPSQFKTKEPETNNSAYINSRYSASNKAEKQLQLQKFADRCIQLVNLIFKFPETKSIYLEKFINCFNRANQNDLKLVTESIIKSFDKKDLHCFVRLFQARLRFLDENVKDDPAFSWSMPGSISGHPRLDDFLRSETQQMITYKGQFDGIWQARDFQDRFKGLHEGFSLNIPSTAGIGKNASVTIEKTRTYYDNHIKVLAAYRREQTKLKKLLKEV